MQSLRDGAKHHSQILALCRLASAFLLRTGADTFLLGLGPEAEGWGRGQLVPCSTPSTSSPAHQRPPRKQRAPSLPGCSHSSTCRPSGSTPSWPRPQSHRPRPALLWWRIPPLCPVPPLCPQTLSAVQLPESRREGGSSLGVLCSPLAAPSFPSGIWLRGRGACPVVLHPAAQGLSPGRPGSGWRPTAAPSPDCP